MTKRIHLTRGRALALLAIENIAALKLAECPHLAAVPKQQEDDIKAALAWIRQRVADCGYWKLGSMIADKKWGWPEE